MDKGLTRGVPGRGLSPADKLDDLQVIVVAEASFGPFLARNDAAIQFNGDTVGLHA